MKAAILYGKEDLRIEQAQPRPLRPGEVRIEVEATLTCGTDLKVFKRGYHARMLVPPAPFGHELAGRICELGPSVNGGWAVGDRVVVANSAPCGHCPSCASQQENLCDDLLFLNGAYAEMVSVPARLVEKNLLKLKPETDFRDAALVEPLACVVQGIEDCRLKRGQNVLVIGAGPIGLMFVKLGLDHGCSVTVAGRGERRLETARRLGAHRVVTAAELAQQNGAPSPGSAFDVVIEAVGKPETWELAIGLVRKGGTVNLFGGCPAGTSVSLDTSRVHYSSLNLCSSFHHTPATVRKALAHIEAGAIRSQDFVDGDCPLSELPRLFRSMAEGNRFVKTLVRVRD
jgi:L-iditol 2-dehydrogenase